MESPIKLKEITRTRRAKIERTLNIKTDLEDILQNGLLVEELFHTFSPDIYDTSKKSRKIPH